MAQIYLNIDVEVLTANSAALIVNEIFESLLFSRNQIPHSFKIYQYYVNKWKEEDEEARHKAFNFQVQRLKNNATDTKNSISAMKKVISEVFERKLIKTLRFLFGSTAFTPKEAYTIHIPSGPSNHLNKEHHKISPAHINQTLLSLLTNEKMCAVFSNHLRPTNIYLEFELLDNSATTPSQHSSFLEPSSMKPGIFPKQLASLPPSCKEIHLHLLPKPANNFEDDKQFICKEIQIFEDIANLNLENVVSQNDYENNDLMLNIPTNDITGWWESEIVIRGFKDQPIKGFKLWS